MSSKDVPFVRTRLSMLMFLTFFLWGSWGVAITGLADSLGFQGWQIGLLGAVPAIGAMISPLFVGLIADRFFPAQRVLSVLHLFGGICLIIAGFQNSFPGLMTLMMLNGLFFMPTIALANSVAFTHIPDPDKFPRIAVLGTIGWIAAVLFASVFLGGASQPYFLFQAGAAGIVLAFYSWTLPNTPPKGAEAGGDVFGLSAVKLLKENSFLIFIICVFLVSIPACGYFFTLQVPMLMQRGYPSPLALTSLNQFAEIIFMFSMPWFVAIFGLKRVVAIGMLAWAVRYLFFACPDFSAALFGLVLHGFCYSFFYVGAYMYVDKRAPAELKSSAQSLLTFLLLGVGFFVGSMGAGQMMQRNKAKVPDMAVALGDAAAEDEERPLPPWNDPNAATSVWRFLDLNSTVKQLLGKAEEAEVIPDMSSEIDANEDGNITMDEVRAMSSEGVTLGKDKFTRDEMVAVFKKIASVDAEGEVAEDDISLTRKDWLSAQSCDWWPIWIWPSIGVFIVLAIFVFAFRGDPKKDEAGKDGDEAPGGAGEDSPGDDGATSSE
jgi:nucleoside transporter